MGNSSPPDRFPAAEQRSLAYNYMFEPTPQVHATVFLERLKVLKLP